MPCHLCLSRRQQWRLPLLITLRHQLGCLLLLGLLSGESGVGVWLLLPLGYLQSWTQPLVLLLVLVSVLLVGVVGVEGWRQRHWACLQRLMQSLKTAGAQV
jgi:hypothetical protein